MGSKLMEVPDHHTPSSAISQKMRKMSTKHPAITHTTLIEPANRQQMIKTMLALYVELETI